MNLRAQTHLILLMGAIVAAGLPAAAALADPQLEARIARIERIITNQAGSELLLQIQQIQMELQELRGLVEMQQFEIQRLQRQGSVPPSFGMDQPSQPSQPSFEIETPDLRGGQDTRLNARPDAGSGALSGLDLDPLGPLVPNDPNDRSLDPARIPNSYLPPQTQTPPSGPGAGIPSLPLPESSEGSERDGYAAAFALLKERQYDEANSAFNDLLRRYPQGQFSDNARYWLGETYYVQRNLPAAITEFDRLIQFHPNSPKVPAAMLKIGNIYSEQQAYDQALIMLEELMRRHPTSTEARLAKSRLERIADERQIPPVKP